MPEYKKVHKIVQPIADILHRFEETLQEVGKAIDNSQFGKTVKELERTLNQEAKKIEDYLRENEGVQRVGGKIRDTLKPLTDKLNEMEREINKALVASEKDIRKTLNISGKDINEAFEAASQGIRDGIKMLMGGKDKQGVTMIEAIGKIFGEVRNEIQSAFKQIKQGIYDLAKGSSKEQNEARSRNSREGGERLL